MRVPVDGQHVAESTTVMARHRTSYVCSLHASADEIPLACGHVYGATKTFQLGFQDAHASREKKKDVHVSRDELI